jgi:predicted Zn finger-like uncharacterized protein
MPERQIYIGQRRHKCSECDALIRVVDAAVVPAGAAIVRCRRCKLLTWLTEVETMPRLRIASRVEAGTTPAALDAVGEWLG